MAQLGIHSGSWSVLEEVCAVPASRAAPVGRGCGCCGSQEKAPRPALWRTGCSGPRNTVRVGTFPNRAMHRPRPLPDPVSPGLPELHLAPSQGPAPGLWPEDRWGIKVAEGRGGVVANATDLLKVNEASTGRGLATQTTEGAEDRRAVVSRGPGPPPVPPYVLSTSEKSKTQSTHPPGKGESMKQG